MDRASDRREPPRDSRYRVRSKGVGPKSPPVGNKNLVKINFRFPCNGARTYESLKIGNRWWDDAGGHEARTTLDSSNQPGLQSRHAIGALVEYHIKLLTGHLTRFDVFQKGPKISPQSVPRRSINVPEAPQPALPR